MDDDVIINMETTDDGEVIENRITIPTETAVETPAAIEVKEQQSLEETIPDVSPNDEPVNKPTYADRIRGMVEQPDFQMPKYQTIDQVMKSFNMPFDKDIAHDLVNKSGIHEDVGEQTAVALENFLTNLGTLPDKAEIAFGNLENAIVGGTLGQSLSESAYESMKLRLEDMQYAEDSVGGVRNLLSQIVAGATSMTELMLVGLATGGVGALAQIGVESLGESAFNDMQAYEEEYGTMAGYVPKNKDVALNIANAIAQVAIERYLGVGSPRFLHGASRGFVKEAAGGFLQESSQSALADVNEWLKGHQEWQDIVENANQYIIDGVIGGLLQGTMGAATHYNAHRQAQQKIASTIAQVNGRDTPNEKDLRLANEYVNNTESQVASAITTEIADEVSAQGDELQTPQRMDNKIAAVGRAVNSIGGTTAVEEDGVITVSKPATDKTDAQIDVYVDEEKAQKSKYYTPSDQPETESGLQRTLQRKFGDKVDVQKLKKMSIKDSVDKATEDYKADRQKALDLLQDDKANALDRATMYNALYNQIDNENDSDLLDQLSNPNIAKFAREAGQTVAMFKVGTDTGFNMVDVATNLRNAKGFMTDAQFNQEIVKINLDKVVLTDADIKALANETECKL